MVLWCMSADGRLFGDLNNPQRSSIFAQCVQIYGLNNFSTSQSDFRTQNTTSIRKQDSPQTEFSGRGFFITALRPFKGSRWCFFFGVSKLRQRGDGPSGEYLIPKPSYRLGNLNCRPSRNSSGFHTDGPPTVAPSFVSSSQSGDRGSHENLMTAHPDHSSIGVEVARLQDRWASGRADKL